MEKVLSYWMLNLGAIALAALLLLTSPLLAILLLGCFISGVIMLDCDFSMKLIEKFGIKPEISHLKNSVVWITGASSGLGEELAYRLSKVSGVSLVLSSRKEKELERVAENCKSQGCANVLVVPLDVAEYNMHEKCLQKVVDEFGKVNVLVNNAGVYQQGFVLDTDFTVLKRTIEVDLLGQVSLTKLVAKHMKENNVKGLIGYVSSIASSGMPYTAIYSAAKAGLNSFADALRCELSEYGIDVLVMRLGPVKTKIGENSLMKRENEVGGSKSGDYFNANYNPMSLKRAVELMTYALANRVPEAWIVHKFVWLMIYAYEYIPSTAKWVFGKSILMTAYKKTDAALKN